MFLRQRHTPENIIPKKAAKQLGKKRNRIIKEDGPIADEEDNFLEDEDYTIPLISPTIEVLPSYDAKSLIELKNRARIIFDKVKT